MPQSCTQREITSLQEKQTREDLPWLSFCIEPSGRLRSTSTRSCRTEEVAMLSHTAMLSSLLHLHWDYFVLLYPPTNIFPKMGLCMFIQNQTLCLLHLVNIPHYVVQRGISFDANTLLAVYKKNQCFLEPWKGSAGGLPGNRLYTPKASGTSVVTCG